MPVNSEHPDYSTMLKKWQRCRDVCDGEDAVHKAGEKYLPKLMEQSQQEYAAYVMRTPFYNASWRTVAGLVGMIFRKDPQIEAPAKVEEMFEDVTLGGVPFIMFLQNVTEEALKIGRLGVLVDYPTVATEGMTQADAQAQNLRPTMQLYKAESIINWKLGRVKNATVLVQVVIKECIYESEDEFKKKEQEQYRVLDLIDGKYRVRIFQMKQSAANVAGIETQIGSDVFPLMNGQTLDFIPFTFLATDDVSSDIDEPPLIDLINTNLSHYRTSADLEHGAHFTGLPTPVVSGYTKTKDGEKLYIGSAAAWLLADPQATAKYLEFTGQGLGALEKLKESKEQQMAVLGARMLEPQKKGVESSESLSIHRKGEESMLAAASMSLSMGMTKALKWFSDWAGAPDAKVKVDLNKDFYPVSMTDKMLSALVAGWQQGAYSYETLFNRLKDGEIVDEDTDLQTEQARMNEGPPRLTGQLVDPATGLPKEPATKLDKSKAKKPGEKTPPTPAPKPGEKGAA